MALKTVGLDTAKHVFQVYGVDAGGRPVLRKRLRRSQIPVFFADLPQCVVGIEATQGAHCGNNIEMCSDAQTVAVRAMISITCPNPALSSTPMQAIPVLVSYFRPSRLQTED